MQRIGLVAGLSQQNRETYLSLHRDDVAGVRDLMEKYNMRNFSIFRFRVDAERELIFGYYEYCGDDYEADQAALAREPRNIEWLKQCDPCQIPLREGDEGWGAMEQIYYNE
jgi:L-rhamnose mutarotase